jgi:dihydrolipoamide dehydrogenase
VPLAHTASWEADVVIDSLMGKTEPLEYSSVPRCIYTWPEAAAVGLTEEEARKAGYTPRIDRYHFAGNSKAMIEGEPEGVWVSLSDASTHKLLGGLIVGSHATEMIHLVALGLKAKLSAEEISDTIFAHPSLAESFREVVNRSLIAKKTQASS